MCEGIGMRGPGGGGVWGARGWAGTVREEGCDGDGGLCGEGGGDVRCEGGRAMVGTGLRGFIP